MIPEEKKRIDAAFAELTKHELAFLKDHMIEPNEHGAYVFISQDGNTRISLDLILSAFRNYLIEHRIVKEL